ncbi:MAG: hypothetical protein M1834_001200 [Cirrosporium novae-zelandiae]|nr:MAG: hypothetical protein M1834_001200 [Cirrosporium novae-zelandiae]
MPPPQSPFVIRNVATGMFLSVAGRETYAGAPVVLESTTASEALRWSLQKYQDSHYLINESAKEMCLNVSYESTEAGAGLQQWSCNGGASELWTLSLSGRGVFNLINKNSGLAVGAAEMSCSSGSTVVQLASTEDDLAQWEVINDDTPEAMNAQSIPVPKPIPTPHDPLPGLGAHIKISTLADEMIYNIYTPIFSSTGNLEGVTRALPHIASMGFSTILLMPIHPIGVPCGDHPACNSPYAVADHYSIDPSLGQNSDFSNLIQQAHGLGMKIMMDAVLNHTAWTNPLISQHPEYYVHTDGNPNNPQSISQAFTYSDVAQLDYKSKNGKAVLQYMTQMLTWWMENFNIDGFRFDMVDNPYGDDRMIPAWVWSSLGKSLRNLNPNVILLGELNNPSLSLKPFNLDYHWDFQPALSKVTTTHNATPLINIFEKQKHHPPGMHHLSLTQNWDTDSDLSTYNGPDATLATALFNFTTEGIPLLFAGQEIGNDHSGHNTHTPINWNAPLSPRFHPFYTSLALLRRTHSALRTGPTKWHKPTGNPSLILFLRTGKTEQFFIAINFSPEQVRCAASGVEICEDWREVTPPRGAAGCEVEHPQPPQGG